MSNKCFVLRHPTPPGLGVGTASSDSGAQKSPRFATRERAARSSPMSPSLTRCLGSATGPPPFSSIQALSVVCARSCTIRFGLRQKLVASSELIRFSIVTGGGRSRIIPVNIEKLGNSSGCFEESPCAYARSSSTFCSRLFCSIAVFMAWRQPWCGSSKNLISSINERNAKKGAGDQEKKEATGEARSRTQRTQFEQALYKTISRGMRGVSERTVCHRGQGGFQAHPCGAPYFLDTISSLTRIVLRRPNMSISTHARRLCRPTRAIRAS